MTAPALGGRVLDVAALVDLAENRTVYGRALVATALEHGTVLAVPAAALASARARGDTRARARLHLLPDLWAVVVDALDLGAADAAGDLLATSNGTDSIDVPAAHVALVALRRGWPVVTDRGEHLRAVADMIEIEPLP